MICSTAAYSWPSIAMMSPRVWKAEDAGLGFARGVEALARTRILFTVDMDVTIASTDLACVDSPEIVDLWRGGRVRDESGLWATG